jgi:hypothetical protein
MILSAVLGRLVLVATTTALARVVQIDAAQGWLISDDLSESPVRRTDFFYGGGWRPPRLTIIKITSRAGYFHLGKGSSSGAVGAWYSYIGTLRH